MLRNLVAVLIVDAFQLTSMKPEQEMLRNLLNESAALSQPFYLNEA